jgi:hypothetical protein
MQLKLEVEASRKAAKYTSMIHSYLCCPEAIETLGQFFAASQLFISGNRGRFSQQTSYPRETGFSLRRISVAIQRLNAMCLANTFVTSD